MERNKVVTFIGFAIRARKVKCGVNAIKTLKGSVPVIIICKTASQNTFDEVSQIAKKLSAQMLISEEYLVEDIVHKENCKVVAITDKALAKAVLEHSNVGFTKYSGGYGK